MLGLGTRRDGWKPYYPIHYLIADSAPLSVLAAAKALNLRAAKVLQDSPDHVETDARTGVLNVADSEWAGLRFNRRLNESSFRPAWRFDLPDALLELLASLHEGEQKEVHRRSRVVFAVVPALRTLFENFVVTLFVLFSDRQVRAAFVDQFQGVAVTAHFLLVAIAQGRLSENPYAPPARRLRPARSTAAVGVQIA
jgi:hypothetical protein